LFSNVDLRDGLPLPAQVELSDSGIVENLVRRRLQTQDSEVE
jgi:hypothetical protein